MQKRNYQRELEQTLAYLQKEGKVPTLLLHACCAPCSSYVLEYLSSYFKITIFFYNPNISPAAEYEKRVEELHRLVNELPAVYPIKIIDGLYEPEKFYEMARGLEMITEGGARCFACYRLRLEETARIARDHGFDYFTTTLSISPLKNVEKLNTIGEELAGIYQVDYLHSDFKKKNGYKRSIELSTQYGLYRQDYCGCIYSKQERERQKQKKTGNGSEQDGFPADDTAKTAEE